MRTVHTIIATSTFKMHFKEQTNITILYSAFQNDNTFCFFAFF
uniref:Uncharacterized protein n=1 Tax=Heterorhabditis bacteriophora TaxID=37862 RepID=A0A1I7WGS1_HETBA